VSVWILEAHTIVEPCINKRAHSAKNCARSISAQTHADRNSAIFTSACHPCFAAHNRLVCIGGVKVAAAGLDRLSFDAIIHANHHGD